MATIKFLLQSTSSTAPIYLRLSLGRNNTLKRKTGYIIDAKAWGSNGFPKERDANSKNIKGQLLKLSAHVINEYNSDNSKGTNITGEWLSEVIEKFHNRKEPEQKEFLTIYGNSFVEALPNRAPTNGGKGVNKDTVGKYKTIVDKLKGFEEYKGKKYLIKDVGITFRDEFIKYLIEIDGLNSNTAGRYISFVKTIILDARKHGYEISHQIDNFKGYTVDAPIITLSFEEIEKIKKADLSSDKLQIARDWLVIGCYTGQRVSDLLRMNEGMITKVQRYNLLTIVQQKTKKTVQIPIHHEVKAVLEKRNGEFPPTFAKTSDSNSAMFNRYLKELCKEAGIDTPTKGNLIDPDTGIYGTGIYPKHMLISSHICRRSFATNFYSQREYPTPLLMSVTGHATETMFLNYIGKKPLDYALQLAEIWESKANNKKNKNKSELTTLKA
ncbi:site-specific integrase [Flavobacterium sp. C4GT6]|uniref:site-specific integrase n=1 Tax=Flavobacterium sp. C4GT6 TaxID=3103818 RepID=UPI002ECFCC99